MTVTDDVRRKVQEREKQRQRNLGAADLRVRVPDEVHRAASDAARELGVSLNAFVVAAVEVAVGAK